MILNDIVSWTVRSISSLFMHSSEWRIRECRSSKKTHYNNTVDAQGPSSGYSCKNTPRICGVLAIGFVDLRCFPYIIADREVFSLLERKFLHPVRNKVENLWVRF